MLETLTLMKGTLDLLVLKALTCGANHGYGISRWLEEGTKGELTVADSALYQALHRLDDRGLVVAEWGVTNNGRRARFYRVTATGRKALEKQSTAFNRYARMVTGILAVESAADA